MDPRPAPLFGDPPRAPSTGELRRLESDLARLAADLVALDSGDGSGHEVDEVDEADEVGEVGVADALDGAGGAGARSRGRGAADGSPS